MLMALTDTGGKYTTHQTPCPLGHGHQTVLCETPNNKCRVDGTDWPASALTMIGVKRMKQLRKAITQVLADGLPGDLIECGCWRGGASIFMAATLEAYESTRKLFVCDSFEGLPAPYLPQDEKMCLHLGGNREYLSVPIHEVRENFMRYGLLNDRVEFVHGWFKDTLPKMRDRKWCVIRADGDMYSSTREIMENLYPGLTPHGILICDDYHDVPECKLAIDEYRSEKGITSPIIEIDDHGIWWRA